MIYIVTETADKTISHGGFHLWNGNLNHVGNAIPKDCSQYEVSVEGPELEFLRQNFTGIPFHKEAAYQIWRGDFARFIVDHL